MNNPLLFPSSFLGWRDFLGTVKKIPLTDAIEIRETMTYAAVSLCYPLAMDY